MATADHAGIPFIEALKRPDSAGKRRPMYTRGRPDGPPLWIVIHDMEFPERGDAAEWTGDYFHDGAGGRSVSSHYCADSNSIVQCVRLSDSAWTVGNRPGNNRGINWELAGYASQSREQWLDGYSRSMLQRIAPVIRADAARFGIPLRLLADADVRAYRPGVTSHWQLGRVFGGTDHTDPGPNFPWDYLMALLTEEDDMTPDEKREHWFSIWREKGMLNMEDPIVIPANPERGVLAEVREPNRLAQAIKALQDRPAAAVDAKAVAAELAKVLPKPLSRDETAQAAFEGAQRAEKE